VLTSIAVDFGGSGVSLASTKGGERTEILLVSDGQAQPLFRFDLSSPLIQFYSHASAGRFSDAVLVSRNVPPHHHNNMARFLSFVSDARTALKLRQVCDNIETIVIDLILILILILNCIELN
jgi:hypothetical protein